MLQHGHSPGIRQEGKQRARAQRINVWLWQFGRGKHHVWGLSVADTEDRRIAVLQDGARRGHATLIKRLLRCSGERISLVYLESSQIYNICLESNKDNTGISQFEYGISQGCPRDIF